jgi:hypothetical protein
MSKFKKTLLNPKNWFLTGKEKASFWAVRKYSGETLEHVLVDIDHGTGSVGANLAHLDVKKKYGSMTNSEFEKERANLLEEPYVTVVKVHMDSKAPSEGFFELDWNDKFVQQLQESGYNANSPEMIVKLWFDEICANVARENGAVFLDEIEEFKHKTARKVKSENGKTEVL